MEDKKAAALTVQQRLQSRPKDWLQKLQQNPNKFADLEQEIHRAFAQMADQVVAGLLAVSTAAPTSPLPPKKVTPADTERKLRFSEPRPLRIRLLGGLLLWVTTLYCSPALRTGKGRRGEGAGLYPELSVLHIQEGHCTPQQVRWRRPVRN